MTALANTARRPLSVVGQRVELARYTITSAERAFYGQRVGCVVRVTDSPARGRGRAFLVERGIEQDGNAALQALIVDYILCDVGIGRTSRPYFYADRGREVLHLPRS